MEGDVFKSPEEAVGLRSVRFRISNLEFRNAFQPAEGGGDSVGQALAQGLILGAAADVLADAVAFGEVFNFYSNVVSHWFH